jgi:hypothetical protein
VPPLFITKGGGPTFRPFRFAISPWFGSQKPISRNPNRINKELGSFLHFALSRSPLAPDGPQSSPWLAFPAAAPIFITGVASPTDMFRFPSRLRPNILVAIPDSSVGFPISRPNSLIPCPTRRNSRHAAVEIHNSAAP